MIINAVGLGAIPRLSLCHTRVDEAIALRYVRFLDLTGCQIEDVAPLAGMHTLDLSYNVLVKNVQALYGLHALYLVGTKVEDVSMLGALHTLDLSRSLVRHVGQLRNLNRLVLKRMIHDITDIETVSCVPNLVLV